MSHVAADCRLADDCKRVVATTVERHGGLDILVNNDGAPPVGPILGFDDTAWHKAVEQNLMFPVRMVREAVPHMKERGGGSILNITAISAIQPIRELGLSVATWSAVIGYAKTLSMELGEFGINVNTICPGYIDTSRLRKVFASGTESSESVQDRLAQEVPMRRIGTVEDIANLVALLPELRVVVCVDDVHAPGVSSFQSAVAQSPALAAADRFHMDPDEIMRMCFMSGTTGNPKGVLHSFNTTLCAAQFLSEDMEVTSQDVFLVYLPVGLNWGYLTLLQVVMAGAKGVLLERFSARAALDLIEAERVTYIPTAPASIVAILNAADLKQRDLSALRVILTGGASASIETIRALQQAVPHARLVELYGMLETGFHSYTRLDDDPVKVNGTIGRCIRQLKLGILDDAGAPVAHGQSGEQAAKGPSVHLVYLNNPAANQDSFTSDGWFRTGDLGEFVDDIGNVRISGRKKEIINRGGKKYFPREIEEILYEHPAFLFLVIVGLPDPRLGERNCLCAVLKPGTAITLEEVVAMLRGRVADYKLPEQLELLAELPMTPTGKVRRPELVKQLVAAAKR